MINRTAAALLAILGSAVLAGASETITATSLKSGMADCWDDPSLEGNATDLMKDEWQGPLTAKEVHGRALLFVIGKRRCWVDRKDVEIQGLPSSSECEGKVLLGKRGVGGAQECKR